jgi:hypothetical protein
MLRLAHPAPSGQGTDPPKRRKGYPAPALSLTADEARAVRAAARNIARTYGSLRKLAAALGVNPNALTAKKGPGPGLAIALARVSGMSVDAVLGWKALAAVPSPGGCLVTAADEDSELRALNEAWRAVLDTQADDYAEGDRPLLTLLLAAVTGGSYEGAEADPPAVAVLRSARATVEGWARAHGASTLFASVAFVELELLVRRLDVALAIVKRSPGGVV